MRRLNLERAHREGYSWFRFQESKTLFFFTLFLLLSLSLPVFTEIGVSIYSYFAHAFLTLFVVRYACTEILIAAEQDGIYLEINRKKYKKILDWEEKEFRFLTENVDDQGAFQRENILVFTRDDEPRVIYESLCGKMTDFFHSSCSELINAHYRRRRRKFN